MNNKTILLFFTMLGLTMMTICIFMGIATFNLFSQPTKVYYTVNTYTTNNYQYTNTYNTTEVVNKPPAKPVAPSKPKQTSGYSEADINLLARLINAEAKGESFNGKVAVGNVILNRVKSSKFPNTIRDVIYQPRQFQPVSNGAINNQPSEESLKAAHESLKTNLIGNALYFYNPYTATDAWIRTREVTTTIGNHSFAV
jgi:spore germination cell wall hydrolase CwlJ-like protein